MLIFATILSDEDAVLLTVPRIVGTGVGVSAVLVVAQISSDVGGAVLRFTPSTMTVYPPGIAGTDGLAVTLVIKG
jgi:hypothetical protein